VAFLYLKLCLDYHCHPGIGWLIHVEVALMNMDIIKNKRVLVVGLGVTGESVVRFLHAQKVLFDVVDEKSLPALQSAAAAGIEIIGDIELFAQAIGDTPVIAVTGSNGKSTVVSWVAHVLNHCGKRVRLCGNIGTPALDSIDASTELYVLELSSYQLESTSSLKTISATVLNISDDHMDRYTSIDHYAQVKRRVYRGCAHSVVNLDDKRTWDKPKSSTAFSLSNIEGADYHVEQAANDAWLCHGESKLLLRSQLQTPGDHNVANVRAQWCSLVQRFKRYQY